MFGAVFANVLAGNLASHLRGVQLPAGLTGTGGASPGQLEKLPTAVYHGYISGYAESLQTIFLIGVPIAVAAFLLTWLLPEITLRRAIGAVDPGETYAMPEDRTSLQEVQRALTVLARRENRPDMYRRLAERSGLDLEPAEVWLLLRIDALRPANLDELIPRFDISRDRLTEAAQALHERTLLTDGLTPTPTGEQTIVRLREARRDGLANLLKGWSPAEHPELDELITRLSGALTDSEPAPTEGTTANR